ncbi:MAG TPA: hypothetical protein VMY98_08030 [Anaerolineae bacterium]|nr:hypothetical protein [Anaerolineae bacterium]
MKDGSGPVDAATASIGRTREILEVHRVLSFLVYGKLVSLIAANRARL